MKLNTLLFLGTAAILLTGGSGYWYFSRDKEEVKWRYGKVARGDIRDRVSATGTLSAIMQVDVGSQVSGMVTSMDADFNSIVKKDQIIATIDPQVYEQKLQEAKNNLEQRRTALIDAQAQLKRYQNLAKEGLCSKQDLENREVTYKNAQISFDNAQINVTTAETNLGYCTIRSTVNGVVISRVADVGQTLQASYNAPSLFKIAEDLSVLKLEISIDESDIAKVAVGQTASFTVDAAPEHQFYGTVSQVRLDPTNQQNVVTYKVVVEVKNQTKQEVENEQQRSRERRQAMMAAFGSGGGRGQGRGTDQVAQTAAPGTEAGAPKNASNTTAQTTPEPQPPEGRSPQATPPEGRSGEGRIGRESRPGGGFVMKEDGTPDYDATWENLKEIILQRQPGITKEAWIQQTKEQRAQRGNGGGQRMMGPGGQRAQGDTPRQQPTQQRTASGVAPTSSIIKAGGQFYQDEYVLRPGMTAMVTIVTKQANNVLYVPSIALRFDASQYVKNDAPVADPQQPSGGQQQQPQQGPGMMMMRNTQQERRARIQDRGFASTSANENRIWVMDEKGKPTKIPVIVGLTDGSSVEISGESITEGMEILIGVNEAKSNKTNTAANPFQMGGGGMRR
jgi:HlyD family secretion protein